MFNLVLSNTESQNKVNLRYVLYVHDEAIKR